MKSDDKLFAIIGTVGILAGLVLALCGCAHVTVHAPNWDASVWTFCKDIEAPPFTVGATNFDLATFGAYKSKPTLNEFGEAFGIAIKAAGYGGGK